jgi:hypothetical protein
MHTKFPAPAVTCALALVHSGLEYSPANRIVAAAAFAVIDDTVGTRFESLMAIVPPSLSRLDSIAHVAKLAPNCATVLVRPPRLPRGLVRHLAAGGSMPVPTIAQSLTALRPDLDLQPISIPETAMATLARYFGLSRAGRDDVIAERARRVEDEAQAIFLASMFCRPDQRERVRLAAAYEAWRALQRARPLSPFGPAEAF